MKKLIIISNDKIYFDNKFVYTDFNDTLNIIEGLSKKYYLYFFSRKNKVKGIYKTKIKNKTQLKISQIRSLDLENKKIFMISITPFSFFIFKLINLFHGRSNGFVILRSDGFKEYSLKFSLIGKKLYEFFFKKILKQLKPIIVTKKLSNISNYKYLKIYPSEITSLWKKNLKKAKLSKARLLYLGRIKKEKGVFSLIKLVKDFNIDFSLNIVGSNKNFSYKSRDIKVFKETSNIMKIIDFYDKSNIFILPSFTEGSPKVILESLSRQRPVIVFNDISHVKSGMKGIFISNRDTEDLQKTVIYILKNYKKIQSEMKKNIIPTKEHFQKELIKIVK